MKICLIKTSSMGDILHTLPALTDAQCYFPDLQVDWVVEEGFAEIPTWHTAVKQVIPVALRRWRKALLQPSTWNEWKAYRTLLQQHQYDAVIDAQGLMKSALFATRLARGCKHGYDRHSIRELFAACFYDKAYAISYQQHAVERIRQLFAQSLNYSLENKQGDYGLNQRFMLSQSAVDFVMFFHSTTRADKFWLDSEWRRLAEKLTAFGVEIRLPWSNQRELKRVEWIAQDLPSVRALPKLSLTDLASQIVQAKAVVSVDTGLAHLTAALDIPNITLYGATDPQLVGTYGRSQHHLRANSMAQFSADQVFQVLQLILNSAHCQA